MSSECCYLCNECPISYATFEELESHMKEHNITKKSQLEPQSSIEDHDISEIDQHSPSSSDLTDGTMPEDPGPESTEDDQLMADQSLDADLSVDSLDADLQTGFQCRFCPTRFNDRSQLNIHYTHTHRDKPQYECEVCHTVFAVKRELSTHMRIHSGEQPHKCTQCGKEFGTRQLLKKHWMWHTGERSHKGHLTQHLMIHSGGRPHQCKLCQKTFIFKFDLNRHMKIHAERGFSCGQCGRSFIRQVSLDEHSLKCKGKSSSTSRSSTPPMKSEPHQPTPLFPMMTPSLLNFNQDQMAKMAQTILAQQQQRALASLIVSQAPVPPQATMPTPFFCVLCNKPFPNQPSFAVHMYVCHLQSGTTGQIIKSEERETKSLPSIFQPINPIKTETEEEHVNVHSGTATNSSCASSPQKTSPFPNHSPSIIEEGISPAPFSTTRTVSTSPEPASKSCVEERKRCSECTLHRMRTSELEAALLAKGNELEKYKEMMRAAIDSNSEVI
uniref:Zinc finger protein n=1 Tax=Heterorhabditis bacteriophora TaxID=37862 RepID=A0A1I7XHB7_HETBA